MTVYSIKPFLGHQAIGYKCYFSCGLRFYFSYTAVHTKTFVLKDHGNSFVESLSGIKELGLK